MTKFPFLIKIIFVIIIYYFILLEGIKGIGMANERKNWIRIKAEITAIRIREKPYLNNKKYADSWVEYKYKGDKMEYRNEEVLATNEIFLVAATEADIRSIKEKYYKIGSLKDIIVNPDRKRESTLYTDQAYMAISQTFFSVTCIFVLGYYIIRDLKSIRNKK